MSGPQDQTKVLYGHLAQIHDRRVRRPEDKGSYTGDGRRTDRLNSAHTSIMMEFCVETNRAVKVMTVTTNGPCRVPVNFRLSKD